MFNFNKLTGATLNSISRVCGLIKLDFRSLSGEIICIHSQDSLLRVVKDNQLVLSSEDLFVQGTKYNAEKNKKFSCDYLDITLYDDELEQIIDSLIGVKVTDVKIIGNDLYIVLENNFKLSILPNTLEKDTENYRVFIKGDLNSHYVVENM